MNYGSDNRRTGAGADRPHAPPTQRAKRFRVHLPIRYRPGSELVPAFAENVSRGGLFIVGAQDQEAGALIDVELSLPGARTFTVRAEVRHVLPAKSAERLNRKAGAGVKFLESPAGFDASLAAYLFRLARREEVGVLVTDESSSMLLRVAGYVSQPAPQPEELEETLAASLLPVIGVVVRSAEAKAYRAALHRPDAQDLILELENVSELDEILAQLDKRLAEEAPLIELDAAEGELEDIPAPPPLPPGGAKAEAPSAAAADAEAAPAPSPTQSAAPAPPAAIASTRLSSPAPLLPRAIGPSYTFLVICALLAGAIGFAAAFLMYFDRQPTHYARRASRATCKQCTQCKQCPMPKPCAPPMAPMPLPAMPPPARPTP